MKVFLYGNTLNNSYNLTIFLRAKGIDAEMFLDDSSSLQQDFPWWEDPNLSADHLPSWIHYYRVKPNLLFPQADLKRLIADFSKCDVALVCGWGPIIARKAKVPYLFHSFGSDLNITCFTDGILEAIMNILFFQKPKGIRTHLLLSHLQKFAIKSADKIGIYMGYQINPYVKPLGVLNKTRKLRLAWDIDKYNVPENHQLKEKYKDYEVVYFMIARHTWKSVWFDLKGNDKFIRAFARFVKERNLNVKLVSIEKGYDLEESKKLISSLGIESKVEWVKEMNKDGVRAFNSMSNVVVVDQFWHDQWYKRYPSDKAKPKIGFGSGSIEALSAGRPLITVFFDEDFYDGNHPPILSAFTEDEIYQRLNESIEMGAEGRKKLGAKGYEFVKKYHGWENAVELHINLLGEILEERNGKMRE
ncbi:MAG: glycosyltransferase [Cyclobacteriaceae bacterium]|nr:glycosyltransferase [Cyclobacteriaceae bacterium]